MKGEVHFEDVPAGLELPASVHFEPADAGRRSVEGVAREPGVYRLRLRAANETTTTNPMLVSADGPRVYWGDLHGHSNYSDGSGVPEEYFTYARDVSALDVAALTDHDHWHAASLAIRAGEEIEAERPSKRRSLRPLLSLGVEAGSRTPHGCLRRQGASFPGATEYRPHSGGRRWREGQRALTFTHHRGRTVAVTGTSRRIRTSSR